MKALLALLAAASFLPLVTPAGAQSQAAADAPALTRVLEDATGDIKLTVAGNPADPQGHWTATDLKALDVLESQDDITFTLQVASLSQGTETPAESSQYYVSFLHKDRLFTVYIFRQVLQGASYGAYLDAYDPALDRYDQLSDFGPVTVDAAAGTMQVAFARDLFLDHEGNAPHPEVPFTGWHASATSGAQIGGNGLCIMQACAPAPQATVRDTMPEQGNGTVDLVLKYGIQQSGRARLSSDNPTRSSNGEATTFVYQVEARSTLPFNETFALAASGMPAGWEARLPAQHIEVPANGSILFPVLLTVPFAHQHGTYQKFLLELTSQHDAGSVGRIQLGIRYTQPPQPAGHHNTLYLHSLTGPQDQLSAAFGTAFGGTPQSLYMNAATPEEDPRDAKVDVPGVLWQQDVDPPQVTYRWSVPLSPALDLGVDLNNGTGTVSLPIKTLLPMPGATLAGRLLYVPPGTRDFGGFFDSSDSIDLADLKPGAPVDIAANTAGNQLVATVQATPAGDYVAYTKGANLRLDLEATFTRVDGFGFGPHDAPVAQAGGIVQLPLDEYHDKVAQVFASNSTLVLAAQNVQDRDVNPGKQVLFNLTLANHGLDPLTAHLELTGTHLAWATLLTPTRPDIDLAAGQEATVQVAVKVPTDADKGDTADLVLSATSASDVNVRSLARLYATVDPAHPWPDDAALIAGIEGQHAKKKSPALEPALAALALLGVALLRRRP